MDAKRKELTRLNATYKNTLGNAKVRACACVRARVFCLHNTYHSSGAHVDLLEGRGKIVLQWCC
jgi:hypothetical protein